MKKIFLYAMIAFVSIALMSCNKDKNNVDDPTTENPYAYLRLSDITPLHMISLAKAEEKLARMGYNGGWQKYISDGETYEAYLYTSVSKKDSLFLSPDADGIIESITYFAKNKGVIPSDAKGWLTHIPASVTIPTWKDSLPFQGAGVGNVECNDGAYSQYVSALDNLVSGMDVTAIWGDPMVGGNMPTGDYCGIFMSYYYMNNEDCAYLVLSVEHHVQQGEPESPMGN